MSDEPTQHAKDEPAAGDEQPEQQAPTPDAEVANDNGPPTWQQQLHEQSYGAPAEEPEPE